MAFKVLGSAVIDENENIVSAGSANFAGNVELGATPTSGAAEGVLIRKNGRIELATNQSSTPIFEGYTVGVSSPTSNIKADGSSEFFKTLLKTPTGTANSTNLLTVSDSLSNVNFTVKGTGATNVFGPLVVDRNAGGDPDIGSIVVQSGGAVKTRLNDDGSATFGGVLTGNQRVVINQAGGKTGSANTLLNYAGDGTTVTASFTADGGAAFAGTVDAGALTIGGSSVDTSAQVDAKIAALVDGAPNALNTLNELAAALNDQSDYASSITSILATKANSSSLATVATSGSYTDLSNKPSIPTHTSHLSNNSGFITSADGGNAATLAGFGWSDAGKDVRGTNFYADDWFRNYHAGEGIYNETTGQHFFSASSNYWHINSGRGLIFYDTYNGTAGSAGSRQGFIYHDGGGFGLLGSSGNWTINIPHGTTSVIIGGHSSNNSYNSVSSTRLLFGGGNDPNNYYIGTNLEDYNGNYTKLDLAWHTGIRMGAQPSYGGVRIYNNEDFNTLLFSVGRGDGNTRVESGDLYIRGNLAVHGGNIGQVIEGLNPLPA